MKRAAGQLAVVLVALSAIIAALKLWDPGAVRSGGGTMVLRVAVLCADPRAGSPCEGPAVTLPWSDAGADVARLALQLPSAEGAPLALMMPTVSGALRIDVNGVTLLQDGAGDGGRPRWNGPVLVTVPRGLARDGARADVVLRGGELRPPALGAALWGSRADLEGGWIARLVATQGVALLGVATALLCTVAALVLAAARPGEGTYRWAVAAGLATTILAMHYTPFRLGIPPHAWQGLWMLAPIVLVAALQRFIRRFLRHPGDWLEGATLALVPVAALMALVLPVRWLAAGTTALHGLLLVVIVYQLMTFVRDRRMTTPARFGVLFLLMTAIASLALHDAAYLYLGPAVAGMHLGQVMPLLFAVTIGWLILSRLLRALARQEALARLLRRRVAERSSALRSTSDALREREREALLAEERQRIMMDLHDGVGGHLANALAGLRAEGATDPALRDLLEEAQFDLGLVVDSLQHSGGADGLLAMFRSRVEPILERQGIAFDWRVEDGPHLPGPGPGPGLALLRIVQEFVTNTVKHSGARRITVETGSRHVRLADDGSGFTPPAQGARGHGLGSMRRRAESLGARMTLRSDKGGTELRLDWSEPARQGVEAPSGGVAPAAGT